MAQDDREFDEWLAEHNAAFDTAMRENTRTAEVLQAITARAASEAEQEIEQRVVVAAATGQPLSPEPHWPEDRWRRANIDYAKLVRGIDAAQQRNWMFVCDRAERSVAENRQRWARYDHVTDYDELVAALDSGQIGALERLLELIRPLVVRYCRAHIGYVEGSFAEADQVAMEACISVLRALPGYRITDRSFLGIVYAHTRELVRRHATGGLIEQDAFGDRDRPRWRSALTRRLRPPGTAGEQESLTNRMRALLRALSEHEREVVVLRVVVGLSAQETADALDRTAGWVRTIQHQALTRLRTQLADQD